MVRSGDKAVLDALKPLREEAERQAQEWTKTIVRNAVRIAVGLVVAVTAIVLVPVMMASRAGRILAFGAGTALVLKLAHKQQIMGWMLTVQLFSVQGAAWQCAARTWTWALALIVLYVGYLWFAEFQRGWRRWWNGHHDPFEQATRRATGSARDHRR